MRKSQVKRKVKRFIERHGEGSKKATIAVWIRATLVKFLALHFATQKKPECVVLFEFVFGSLVEPI